MQLLSKNRLAGILFLLLVVGLMAGYAIAGEKPDRPASVPGTYHVVGMGPGDADLMTARALKVIREADLIFCRAETKDKLAGLVDFTGKNVVDGYNVLFRFYGKDCAALSEQERGKHKMSCQAYQAKQTEFAKQVRAAVADGKNVAVLSGGDPTLYGPDLWTVKELADLKPVVVPGLSSFNAATAALEVGLGEIILTAPFKAKDGREEKDTIENLVKYDQAVLVVFMPRDMDDLLARLAAGCSADTPVAVVSYAGHRGKEEIIAGTVGDMKDKLAGRKTDMSLVYVGRDLAEAQFDKQAKPASGAGKFYLVGTGPGDADLATLRALDLIKKADLIFASEKIAQRFEKELAGKTVVHGYHRLFPFYGKACAEVSAQEQAREHMSCEEYHRKQAELSKLVRQAVSEGKTVAMLDSGDPLIYGPCSWTLKEFADIETEVVSGLSCFNAANAALGQGPTEGKTSHSVILASGWSVEKMAALQSTMVLFTMRTEFKTFIDALLKHYPADTPIAIVSSAGFAEKEAVIRGELGAILAQKGENALPFEYLLYVGDFLSDGVAR